MTIDLDQRDVGALVTAQDARLELALVGEPDFYFCSIRHHMGIGQHQPVTTDDKTRAHSFLRRFARRLALALKTAEKFIERIIRTHARRRPRGAHLLHHTDIDYRRAHLLNQRAEIGQCTPALHQRRRRSHRMRSLDRIEITLPVGQSTNASHHCSKRNKQGFLEHTSLRLISNSALEKTRDQ